jgi:hypothetical protein
LTHGSSLSYQSTPWPKIGREEVENASGIDTDVVVTKASGDFVTVLKGGIGNGWFKSAGSVF